MFKAKGILDFTPQDVTKKHRLQSSWKCTAIIKTDCDISNYYSWLLKTRFNLTLNPPLRGSHITFINDRMDKSIFMDASKIFNGKEINFSYNPSNIRSSGLHWWINIESPEAEDVRSAIGLDRNPYFGLHLSLGYANEKNLAHSEYILRICKMFDL